MSRNSFKEEIQRSVSIGRNYVEHPQNTDFVMHNHKDAFEILIFIRGDAEFRVEGSVYDLKPYDTVIAADNEMHRIIHRSCTPYERIVINVSADFFVKNNCEEFSGFFLARVPGEYNLISHESTKNTHFMSCIERLLEYYGDGESDVLIKSVLIELFYILNKCGGNNRDNSDYSNKYIKEVIMYINENLTSEINLDTISEHFFVNKSYLCRIFKRHTGYTVNKYITHKRLMYVRELCSGGMSITQASVEAGFGNYSNFYKMYIKETGSAPSTELKRS